jgi:putative NIF3 family GTP cyclohydrolase 1 type 2
MWACSWGCGEAPVERILISLDMTDAVIEEAVVEKAGLIVSHHRCFSR